MFTTPATLPDDPPTLQLILRAVLAEIERLQLAGLQRNRFGRRSEKLTTIRFNKMSRTLNSPWPNSRLGSTRPPPRKDQH
jgi:hypothetical protein